MSKGKFREKLANAIKNKLKSTVERTISSSVHLSKADSAVKKAWQTGKAFNSDYNKNLKAFESMTLSPVGDLPDIKKEKENLHKVISKIKNEVFKTYLPHLDNQEFYVPEEQKNIEMNYRYRIRIIKVVKWVTEKGENSLDKLKNVYSALSRPECSFAMVADRTVFGTDLYFVLVNKSSSSDPAIVDSMYELFTSALKGNFPGVEYVDVDSYYLLNDSFDLSSVDANDLEELAEIYAEKEIIHQWFGENDEKSIAMVTNIASEKSEDFVSQGIEKLLDGIVPLTESDEYTIFFLAESVKDNEVVKLQESFSELHSIINPYITWQENESVARNAGETLSRNQGKNAGGGANAILVNSNVGFSDSISVSKTLSDTKTRSLNLTKTDYSLSKTKEKIEAQIERLQNGSSLGMWKFATYIVSANYAVANNVANMYRSLTQGDDSYVESAATNVWNVNKYGIGATVAEIKNSLMQFTHPIFKKTDVTNKKISYLPDYVAGYTYINGTEIAMAMNMPNAAVSGLPVIECAEFGRDVISQSANYKPEINLGNVFHMQREESMKHVCLDSKSLTEHVFVTGSTGAGKSTTIYRLLSEAVKLKNEKVTFMVVEPAKGEYRNELFKHTGKDVPITVFGTNPKTDPELLKINPFSFPSDKIHILEHLDRLIEIFNVCWPMYAAMPAILKKGIEESYKSCGWDLLKSENRISNSIFPTFTDVCNNIRIVIDQSDYSAENKGDYKGALVTRLESLTNGINGLIFVADEIPEVELFDRNTIVDLSRVGSTETKSLIMGLLVMKLQEYRMSKAEGSNSPLRHITVLEEAHNLLKRTSTEQNSEGSNLIGKSVEMLSNSIAEMRTYGEAFIIADQAPGLMDMSVIRNTNTKIIMRLPDYSDRELVGKAANLNDDQIIEIAKLRPGVAAVYYNGWINPVLCKVPYTKRSFYSHTSKETDVEVFGKANNDKQRLMIDITNVILRNAEIDDVDGFKESLVRSRLPGEFIVKMFDYCNAGPNSAERKKLIPTLIYLLFDPYQVMKKAEKFSESNMVHDYLVNQLNIDEITHGNRIMEDKIILNILHEHTLRSETSSELYRKYSQFIEKTYLI